MASRLKKAIALRKEEAKTQVKKVYRPPVIYDLRHGKISIERKVSGKEPKPYVPQSRLDKWVWDTLNSYKPPPQVDARERYYMGYTPSTTSYTSNTTSYTSNTTSYTPSTTSYTPTTTSYTPTTTSYTGSYTKV